MRKRGEHFKMAMNIKQQVKSIEQNIMTKIKISKFAEERKKYLGSLKDVLLNRYFETEFEKRLQEREMLLDVGGDTTVNGQKIKISDYITLLKKDLNNLEQRLQLLEDIKDELK